MYTPEPVKSFRKKHFHVGLLPKVSMDEMRLSLTLRHGKRFFRKERSAADIAKDAGGGSKKNEDQDPDDDWDDASSGNGNDGSAPPGGWKKVGNTMNKVQMAAKLAEDLEFEQYKQIDSAALAQMELDITMLEKVRAVRTKLYRVNNLHASKSRELRLVRRMLLLFLPEQANKESEQDSAGFLGNLARAGS